MSFDEISYLDFSLSEAEALRERALAAWEGERREREAELLLIAQEAIHEILGVLNGQDVKYTVGKWGGDGDVEMTIAGMRFKVMVAKDGTDVRLLVKVNTGFQQIKNIAELGRWIDSGEVRCVTD